MMAYRIKKTESLRKNVKRIVRQQIDKAIQLARSSSENDDAIHDVRKGVKRIRAILHLIKPEIGESVYKAEDTHFRSVGQLLNPMRDAKVVASALDDLSKQAHSQNQFSSLTTRLRNELHEVRQREQRNSLSGIVELLIQSQYRVAEWHLRRNHWKTIRHRMMKMFRQSKRAMKMATAKPTSQNLHDWRKRTKYLWHQMEITAPISKRSSKDVARRIHILTDQLGKDRDLFLLAEKTKKIHGSGESVDLDKLSALIACERQRLQEKFFRIGQEAFSHSAKHFMRSIMSADSKLAIR